MVCGCPGATMHSQGSGVIDFLAGSEGEAAGTVDDAAPLLQKLVESTDAYCQTLNCGNLLIYR